MHSAYPSDRFRHAPAHRITTARGAGRRRPSPSRRRQAFAIVPIGQARKSERASMTTSPAKKGSARQIAVKLHRWLGIGAAAIWLVQAITGILLTFHFEAEADRKRVVEGTSGVVRVDFGG